MGDQEIDEGYNFNLIRLNVDKKNFGKSNIVKKEIKKCFKHYSWILIPTEKKNLTLFIYILFLRNWHRDTQLLTYTHPISKSANGRITLIDHLITKFYFSHLDRVIFYTQESSIWAIKHKLIKPDKAYWANNTIDTSEIKKYYTFELPPQNESAILFIGRLIPSKRVKDLIAYYNDLKHHLPDLKLHIIGDGPERAIAMAAMKNDKNVIHYGTLIDEAKIEKIIKQCSMVFVPGLSGLSINHAFAYGRPYITLEADNHGPEISFIEHGKNGYIFNQSFNENASKLLELFNDRNLLTMLCRNAKNKGEALSIEHWIEQMRCALRYD